jgi:hypothetical protein
MTLEPAEALPETGCATSWLSPGQAVYVGPSLELGRHSGSVACFAVGVDDQFTIRSSGGQRRARTALIAPRLTHQLIAHGQTMAFCYLDPASARASLSTSRFLHLQPSRLLGAGVEIRILPAPS